MELENKVPTDITRRRAIARLLEIPPVLFGLASLEDFVIQPQKELPAQLTIVHESTLKKISVDILAYEKKIHIALHLHRTSNAQSLLQDINTDRGDLEFLEMRVKGDLLYRVRELLVAYDLLAAKIMRDQRQYNCACAYANHAVQGAKSMEDNELIATASYTRGCINLQWGQFGVIRRGRFHVNKDKIKVAISDFRDILKGIKSGKISVHPQLHGFTLLQLSRALSLLTSERHSLGDTEIFTLLDQASDTIERNAIDDLYTRMIVTGTLSGLHLLIS